MLGTFRPPTTSVPVAHDYMLQGVVPDGVSKVVVVIGKDRKTFVDIANNVFSIGRDSPVHILRFLRH